ncbi:transmembrane protein 168 [Strongylocentrotus purpuratus]|uniref:Transmembrane protein 168 n=1 Tax=Strongylocentrotus purpuratus TaxID=7668 RepID=A0A7M7RG63_STRPU|nr:transmembrane protein 168 [Strongylocentrotus purpuratus]
MTSIKYFISHCLALPFRAMTSLKDRCKLQIISILDGIVLFAAVCMGLYTCWQLTGDSTIVLLTGFGLLIFALSAILYYYFDLVDYTLSFTHLWYGCLLGIISFMDVGLNEAAPITKATNGLLASSLVLKMIWSFSERACGQTGYTSRLLTTVEKYECIGFSIACMIKSTYMVSLWLLVIAFAFTIASLRLKVACAIPILVLFVTLSATFFFHAIEVPINPFALSCFAGRLLIDPVLDLYFCGLSVLERWNCLINRSHLIHRLLLLLAIAFEVLFLILAGEATLTHEEWYFAIPAYAVFGILWISLHVVFVITTWGFIGKLRECNRAYHAVSEETNKSLSVIMASKGLRFFTTISRRLVASALLSTLFLGAVMWQNHNAAFMAGWLIVLTVEGMLHGLLYELAGALGGTCTAYAVVGPSSFCRADGSAVPLPMTAAEENSNRSMGLLNTIQRFFLHHMIDIYSCDFSTSGLTLDSLNTKLRAFLSRCTEDGPRFDTYLLYYSGHVHANGDWALADNGVLKFDQLLELWSSLDQQSGSRLILVTDTPSGGEWPKRIKSDADNFIAIQTSILKKSTDPETGVTTSVGDFTKEWVDFNCTKETDISWHEQGRRTKAVYAVCSRWSEFTFHQPTESDMESHWQSNFPRTTHPLIKLLQLPSALDCLSLCSGCLYCIRRWKLKWLPPKIINSGHGFKLVQS